MANDSSVLVVFFNENTHDIVTRPVYQYDHGLTIKAYGLENINVNQVHFSNSDTGKAFSMLALAEEDGSISVLVPDTLQVQEKDIYAFFYVEDETSGYTVRTIRMPVIARAKPGIISIDSPQLGVVNQLAKELNDLIDTVEQLQEDTNTAAQNAQNAVDKLSSISFEVNFEDGCLYMTTN